MEYLDMGLKIIAVIITPLFAVLIALYRAQARKISDLHKTDEETILRLKALETKFEQVPGVNDFHDMAQGVTRLAGEIKAIDARIEGLAANGERAERVLSRIETYLLERTK